MGYLILKFSLTAGLIVLISEISKRSSFWGGLLASLPLVSFLAMIWLYIETKDAAKVAALSTSIFWLVLPSLSFFIVLPVVLKRWNFALSLAVSTGFMVGFYYLTVFLAKKAGIAL